jgi:hypothetical protein
MMIRIMVVQLLISLVLLADFNHHITSCEGFLPTAQRSRQLQSVPIGKSLVGLSMATDDDDDDDDDAKERKKSEDSKPISLYELSLLEEAASKKVNDRLLFPYRLGRAFNAAAWTFVLCGILLNVFGYGYIRGQDGVIAVGTMEERNFQVEVNKSAREARRMNERVDEK